MEHARELRARGARRRRDRGRDGRRRAHRRGRRRAARRRRRARRAARRARQRLRAQARHPGRPGRGRARCSPTARSGGSTSPTSTAAPTSASSAPGLDSDASRIANDDAADARHRSSTPTRALRALAAWQPARWTVDVDGEPREFDGYSRRRRQLGRVRRRHVPRPGREARRRPARRRARSSDVPKRALPRQPAEGLQGHPRATSPGSDLLRGARASPSTPTARSRPTPTATRSPTCPPPSTSLPGALRVLAP